MKLVIDIDDTICETIKNSTFFIKGGRGSGRTIENNILMAIYDGKSLEQQPCEDCISRQAVLDEMNIRRDNGDMITAGFIKSLPPVTPQPKTGHWIKSNIRGAKVCSVCNAHMGLSNFKFCPNCGAKMVEQ